MRFEIMLVVVVVPDSSHKQALPFFEIHLANPVEHSHTSRVTSTCSLECLPRID